MNKLLSSAFVAVTIASGQAVAAIDGRVLAGGKPVAGSTVTAFSASAGEPRQLAQAATGSRCSTEGRR